MPSCKRFIETADDVLDRFIVPSFTRIGPALRRRVFDWEDPDLSGVVVAITGPTSGLGLAAAQRMASLGADLVLLARNPDKLEPLALELDALESITVDLADFSAVRRAGQQLAALDRLDVLIHNGGALLNQRSENAEGVELTLATHVVAPAILTTEALPALRRSRGRIITMSSGGMYSQKLDLDDLQNERDYQGAAAYARAKRMQIVLTMEWAQRFGPDVIAHAMHPGWADTPGVAHALPAFKKLVGPLLRTPEEGADTLVWLAGVDRDEIGTGGFWLDRRRRPLDYRPGTVVSEDEAQRLWCQIQDLAGFNCGDEPS